MSGAADRDSRTIVIVLHLFLLSAKPLLHPRRIYLQPLFDVNRGLFFGDNRKDDMGSTVFIVVDPQLGLLERCRLGQVVSRLGVPVVFRKSRGRDLQPDAVTFLEGLAGIP
jgi:hypothetical protein